MSCLTSGSCGPCGVVVVPAADDVTVPDVGVLLTQSEFPMSLAPIRSSRTPAAIHGQFRFFFTGCLMNHVLICRTAARQAAMRLTALHCQHSYVG